MEIYERILQVRKSKKLSQEAFGKELGMSRSMVVNLEMGKLKNEEQVKRYCGIIASIFKVNETWLLTGEGEMTDPPSDDQEIARVVEMLHTGNERIKKDIIIGLSKSKEESLVDILGHILRELHAHGIELDFDDEEKK